MNRQAGKFPGLRTILHCTNDQYSVDTKTDSQMQDIIRSEFQAHTIIMIAHRLSSLLDFDRVAVLDRGQLMEFGEPTELLGNSSSHFAKLYNNAERT